jgi:16S rRNA (cytidine1402-2'-O)-methyltransferase
MGTLFVVSTPIGNLQDITIRALKILFEVDSIACEDTRRTGIFLEKLSYLSLRGHEVPKQSLEEDRHAPLREARDDRIKKPHLISYYEQNEAQRIPEIINALQNGLNVALISDAGTPLISDPGFKLVRECIKLGIKVESIPGASSVLAGLTSSGLPTDKFFFAGYPPHKPGHRIIFFENIKKSQEFLNSTIVLFEAPHKLMTTLKEIGSVFGDIEIALCRELTKLHEEVRREKISDSLNHFLKIAPKGEFVILFHL